MRNAFRRAEAISPDIEDSARRLFAPLAGEQPSPGATNAARHALQGAIAEAGPASGLGMARRLVLASAAVFAPLMAVTAVAALSGQAPLSAPVNFVSSAAEHVGLAGSGGAGHPDTNGQPGTSILAATNATSSTTAEASQTSQTASDAAHTNGKGCDDVLFKLGQPPFATPGGPQGCDVGSSAAHRKNGQDNSQSAQNGNDSSQSSQTSQGPSAAAHEDGNGCDDTLFQAGHPPFGTPGGPQGCDVGSSGDHRQNGQAHGQSGNALAPSASPASGSNSGSGGDQGTGGPNQPGGSGAGHGTGGSHQPGGSGGSPGNGGPGQSGGHGGKH